MGLKLSPGAALLLLLQAFAPGAASDATEVVVDSEFGQIVGQSRQPGPDEPTCDEFLGIPFAEPPVGALRFEPPVPWSKDFPSRRFVATSLGSACIQVAGGAAAKPVGSEDCLYLNIWRPRTTINRTAPAPLMDVMYWIHGGGFREGASMSPVSPITLLYDGCKMAARHNVIVVSVNYRMGMFGFGTFPSESASALQGGVDANWGFQDQREGMHWVRSHIANFGGSCDRVTIFGESAGAISVFHHMASPRSAGLFRAAISQSGVPSAVISAYGLNRTAHVGAAVGCSQTKGSELRACLRSVNASELAEASTQNCEDFFAQECFGPVVDGSDLVEYPDVAIESGRFNKVPLLVGFDTNEINLFVYSLFKSAINAEQEKEYLSKVYVQDKDPRVTFTEEELTQVTAAYNAKFPGPDYRDSVSALIGDFSFICGSIITGLRVSPHAPVFLYKFDQRPLCPQPMRSVPGVYHSLELAYVFGNTYPAGPWSCQFNASEKALSDAMQERWTQFAKTLTPDDGGAHLAAASPVRWTPFTNETRSVMILKEPALALQDLQPHEKVEQCAWLYGFLKSAEPQVAAVGGEVPIVV